MPQTASPQYDENKLPKGQLRKLTALRKSVGENIGNKAFAQWLKSQEKESVGLVDKTAEQIGERLAAVLAKKKISIPRGGYLLTRGRGRVIVTRAAKD